MTIFQKILNLSIQLLPTGRAFRVARGGNREKLYRALAKSDARLYNDAMTVQKSLIPDNIDFTEEMATDWERRLGMITNSAVPLDLRKAAILRKMAAPGRSPGRGHYLWIEYQLQLAGFPVHVYENIPRTNPASHNPAILSQSQHGGNSQHGMQSHYINHVVINSLDNASDVLYSFNVASVIYIGGNPLGTMAKIPAAREKEFRQLILQLKQSQMVAILYVQYI